VYDGTTMEKVALFSLETHSGAYKTWPTKSGLFVDGKPTGKKLPGYVIEAQYKCSEGYLVITSFDCLYEESNAFVLLDSSFDVVAHTQLGVPYATFLIEEHWPINENAIQVRYHGDILYMLSIEETGWFWRRKKLRLRRA
jgi:hypothetical protein